MLRETFCIRRVVLAELFQTPIGRGFECTEPAQLKQLRHRQGVLEGDQHAFDGFQIDDKIAVLIQQHARAGQVDRCCRWQQLI